MVSYACSTGRQQIGGLVIAIYDWLLNSSMWQNLSQRVYDWCQEKKWDIVSHGNMTGSERDLVIAFADDNLGNLEVMSRARKRLIIITRYDLLNYISKKISTCCVI